MPTPAILRKCGACRYHYTPLEGDTLFPEIDTTIEGFCRIEPAENRGGRTVLAGMYRVIAKDFPACGRWTKGDPNW